ncbi:MAG TPA: cytochrome c oxidase subunit 3 [Ramlibacter sp.]|uniref:cytochrome c oxidase subunit 3 n=1 Tax=Ramlibacter sp. TaxID=1917967 RepID=UPI002D7F7CB7|nr:cytochrome c oxidase subunit 3 [Ramlibacter sp.]HET8749073.1 cytochrome c oxidase subunit 3 [Ramlibacter sp.]
MNTRALALHDEGFTARLGMWVFLASEVMFFGGIFVTYAYGRSHWPQGFAEAGRHTHVVIGTVNTALLLTSSAVVAFASACAQHARMRRWTGRLLWLTAAFGAAFLALKGVEYAKEWQEGLVPGAGFVLATPGAQLFSMLYFFATGLHALHLAIGIALVGAMAWGAGRRRAWADAEAVEMGALYWHFVDIVWIFLYPLIYLLGRHA